MHLTSNVRKMLYFSHKYYKFIKIKTDKINECVSI